MRNILLICLYILAVAAFFYFDLRSYFTFEALSQYRDQLVGIVEAYPVLSIVGYILIYTLLTSLSVPGATMMTITGGFLFGAFLGSFLTVFSATLGATILFFLAQTTLGKPLQAKAGPWLKKMSGGFQENAFNYLLTLRFIPIFPFFIVNLVPALLGVAPRTFIVATFIGIIPGTYVFTSVGSGIGKIFESGEEFNASSILSTDIIIGLVGLGILSLLPVIYKRFK